MTTNSFLAERLHNLALSRQKGGAASGCLYLLYICLFIIYSSTFLCVSSAACVLRHNETAVTKRCSDGLVCESIRKVAAPKAAAGFAAKHAI